MDCRNGMHHPQNPGCSGNRGFLFSASKGESSHSPKLLQRYVEALLVLLRWLPINKLQLA